MTQAGRETDTQRLDKWLWHARFVKTRSTASTLVQEGKVRVNREKIVKPAHGVKLGDVITAVVSGRVRVLKVIGFSERRGPAVEARELYVDLTPRAEKVPGEHSPDSSENERDSG